MGASEIITEWWSTAFTVHFHSSFVFSVTVYLIGIIKIFRCLTFVLTRIKCFDWFLVTYKYFYALCAPEAACQSHLASQISFISSWKTWHLAVPLKVDWHNLLGCRAKPLKYWSRGNFFPKWLPSTTVCAARKEQPWAQYNGNWNSYSPCPDTGCPCTHFVAMFLCWLHHGHIVEKDVCKRGVPLSLHKSTNSYTASHGLLKTDCHTLLYGL